MEAVFVYGTLMGREPAAVPACIRGELYDLGPFPAAWNVGAQGAGVIHGEIIEVDAETLAHFDRYEGVSVGHYRRVRVRVVDENGNPNGREAWVYEYGKHPTARGGKKLEAGRWKPPY